MNTRLDELLVESIRPRGLSISEYISDLQRPVGALERSIHAAANGELLRIVRGWPDKDSPLSRCRLVCLLRHFKESLPLPVGSLGDVMLKIVEESIPERVRYIAHLHEMGFSSFTYAYDLFEQTLKGFRKEKGVELDDEHKQKMFQIYLLGVYHMGRSRLHPARHREMILFGVHDSYNALFCRTKGYAEARPQEFVTAYQAVMESWIKSASEKPQSPSYALVRTVFNLLGLTSPTQRIRCATLLDAGGQHLLELNEVLEQKTRVSAGA